MTQIRIVGPLYIDNELELKKIGNFYFKRPPRGPNPHFGAHIMKSAWTPSFLAGPLFKFDLGVPEIDFS